MSPRLIRAVTSPIDRWAEHETGMGEVMNSCGVLLRHILQHFWFEVRIPSDMKFHVHVEYDNIRVEFFI